MSDENGNKDASREAENASGLVEGQQPDQESLERFSENFSGMSKMKKSRSGEAGQIENMPGEGSGIESSVSGAGGLRKGRAQKGGSSAEGDAFTEEGSSEKSGDQNGES